MAGSSTALWIVDAAVTHFINSFSGHSWIADGVMKGFTFAGVPFMVLTVASQWFSGGNRSLTRHVLLSCGLSFLLGLSINQLVLLFLQRARPYEFGVSHLLLSPSTDPSFPSDHAAAAFAIAFIFLIYQTSGRWVFLFLSVMVSLSRVYLGTHYMSDILGGAATALAAAIVVSSVFHQGNWLSQKLVRVF